MEKLRLSKIRDVKTPERGTDKSAGIDFFIPNDIPQDALLISAHSDVLIPTGIKVDIPKGYMLYATNKSGVVTSKWAVRKYNDDYKRDRKIKADAIETSVVLGAATVDEDYQGEVHIHLINTGEVPVELTPGMKIAQFILIPVSYAEIEEVSESKLYKKATKRGEGGFGSTGSK